MRSRRCALISFQAAVLTSFQCFEAHISCCEGAPSFVQNAVLGEVGWGGGASQSVAHLEQVGRVGWGGWVGVGRVSPTVGCLLVAYFLQPGKVSVLKGLRDGLRTYGLRFNSRRSSMLGGRLNLTYERVLALRACPAMFVSSQTLRCLQRL